MPRPAADPPPGGYANAAAQDSFCSSTTCLITEIYDQSPKGNNLTIEGAGGNGGADVGAIANARPVTAGGHKVYGVFVSAGVGYRDDATSGVPTRSTGQGAYMVTGEKAGALKGAGAARGNRGRRRPGFGRTGGGPPRCVGTRAHRL